MEAIVSASKKEVREDKLVVEKKSSLEDDKADADGSAEAEGVIRLTLEEEEEALQDEEVILLNKKISLFILNCFV